MASSAGGFVFSTAPSRLLSAPVATAALREDARKEFSRMLDNLPGTSTLLCVDPAYAPLVSILMPEGASQLREARVSEVFPLDTALAGRDIADFDTLLFMAAPTPALMRLVAEVVKEVARKHSRKYFHLIMCPRRTFVAECILKDAGVLAAPYEIIGGVKASADGNSGSVTVSEFAAVDIIPIEDDLCTLNARTALADVANGDTSPLYAMTKVLMKMQEVYGPFRRIRSKGPMAGAIVDMMLRMRKEMGKEAREISVTTTAAGASGSGEPVPVSLPNPLMGFHLDRAGGDVKTYSAVVSLGALPKPASAEDSVATEQIPVGEIDTCIILDRAVDYVTPLVSPLTYEGLVDEIWNMQCGIVQVENSLVEEDDDDDAPRRSSNTESTTTEMHLNSNSKIYLDLRDCNFQTVGPKLQQKAREIQNLRDSITKSKAADLSVADIRKFVKQIPGLQADMKLLKILVNMTTVVQKHAHSDAFMERWQLERSMIDEDNPKAVTDAIMSAIAKGTDIRVTLRLLCLESVLQGGIKTKQFDAYRRALVHSFGFEILPSLRTLEIAGLLKGREATEGIAAAFSGSLSPWSQLRKSLQLTADDVNVEDPADLHFVTSGYAPLSVRLVQAALGLLGMFQSNVQDSKPSPVATGNWDYGAVAELLKMLPGPVWNVVQSAYKGRASGEDPASRPERKTVLLVFFGGVTHIEMSCLRFISERAPVDFLVVTSCVLNGAKMIGSVVQPLRSALQRDVSAASDGKA